MTDFDPNILKQLTRIADALERLASGGKPSAPNHVRPIEAYAGFDFAEIGAEIVHSDKDGPTHLAWGGLIFTRRSPTNKFEPVIWYSAPAGKDENGEVMYVRLITFKQIKDAEELPPKVADLTGAKNGEKAAIEKYHAEASALHLSEQAAKAILEYSGDLALANAWLKYFGAAKYAGLNFVDAKSHFANNGKDVEKAIASLPVR